MKLIVFFNVAIFLVWAIALTIYYQPLAGLFVVGGIAYLALKALSRR